MVAKILLLWSFIVFGGVVLAAVFVLDRRSRVAGYGLRRAGFDLGHALAIG